MRRLGYITPANASKVLAHDRYWSADFCELYFAACDRLRLTLAADARRMAAHLPGLLQRVNFGNRPEQYRSAAELSSMLVRAWALLGECERLAGSPRRARALFELATREAASAHRISVLAAADLLRRRAALLVEQGRDQDGEHALLRSLEMLERSPPAGGEPARAIAESALVVGALDSGGLPELAKAAAYARPKEFGGDLIFDLALDLFDRRLDGHLVVSSVFDRAGGFLEQARRQPMARGDLLRRSRLSWSEGRVLAMLGIGRLAERRLRRAWRGFEQLRDAVRLALVTLDLVLLDVGQDNRPAAIRRLESALSWLSDHAVEAPSCGLASPELAEVLRQARGATFASLHVFRRRIARRLPSEKAPRSLIPKRRPANVASWALPGCLGALYTERVSGGWQVSPGPWRVDLPGPWSSLSAGF